MARELVYLDYAATTPVDPRVAAAMRPHFSESFGNPSSIHRWGQRAEAAVAEARLGMAAILDCSPEEIVFTASGSESDNLALRGVAFAQRRERGASRILTTPVEHHAVLHTARHLAEHFGFRLELLPVDSTGMVHPEDLETRLQPDTAIVSVIYANNEIGTVNPIPALARICRARGIPFHTDAVQAAGQLPISVTELGVDLLSLGAHKFYGPKGVGALYVRRGTPIQPILTGGQQERGLRAGTLNVPLIVGMAEALRITAEEREVHNAHYAALRDHLLENIPQRIPRARITGHPKERLPNLASFVFHGVDGNQLLAALDLEGFGCSSGSACKTGDPEPSDVLTALGLDRDWSLGSLRLTVGRQTRLEELERFLPVLSACVSRLRSLEVPG